MWTVTVSSDSVTVISAMKKNPNWLVYQRCDIDRQQRDDAHGVV